MKYASLKYGNTTNLGDQIQSFAAEQYLPAVDARFDRDSLASASADVKHVLIMNGWFSHSPRECFPPSEAIVPVFVGFHIADDAKTQAHFLSPSSIEYFKRYEPIGCRDIRTTEMLAERGVDAYCSKCLTLTFPPRAAGRIRDKVALVDAAGLPLPRFIRRGAVRLSHIVSGTCSDDTKRAMARRLLDFYRDEARLVITTRLHCALPCIAMRVPVVFFGNPRDYRLSILSDLNVPLYEYRTGGIVQRFTGWTLRGIPHVDWNPAPVLIEAEQLRLAANVRQRLAERIGYPLRKDMPQAAGPREGQVQ